MKNVLLTIVDLVMNKSGSYRWIAANIMAKVRLVSMVLVLSILSLIILGSALNMIMTDIQRATESQHQLSITSVSAVGLTIVFLSLTAIYLLFRKSVWGLEEIETAPEQLNLKPEATLEMSPLMQALSVLVMDFVEERRDKRQRTDLHSVDKISNSEK